jgi:hypothetical protein
MLRIVVAAIVVAVALGAGQRGDVLERAQLVGGCRAVATPEGESGVWHACRAGRLEGRPDLSLRSCTRGGLVGGAELWRCPAPLLSSRTV